ncbi:topology modulation protein [Actinoplanes sp. NPDC049668]|uniref:topology modulation protein n=1 Tax=unclassified Actinoplanes TaxID=2626549 RepID=UPI0033A7BB22
MGAGGAGKTVLARQLSALLDLPVTHLDALRYTPDWTLVPDDDFEAAQRRAVAGAAWVIDGNSLATLHIRAAAADTIIVLDPHPLVCLLGILRRRLRYRGGQHPDGVFDKITAGFLWYVLTYRARHLPRVMQRISKHRADTTVVHLRSRRAARRYLADVRRHSSGGTRFTSSARGNGLPGDPATGTRSRFRRHRS